MKPSTGKENIKNWKGKIENLLFHKSCGVCFNRDNLENWNVYYMLKNDTMEIECSLKFMLSETFGEQVTSLMPSTELCEKCITFIIQAFLFIMRIKSNYTILQNHIDLLDKQLRSRDVKEEVSEDCEKDDPLDTNNEVSLKDKSVYPKYQKQLSNKHVITNGTHLEDNESNSNTSSEIEYVGKDHVISKLSDKEESSNGNYFMCNLCKDKKYLFNDKNKLKSHIMKVHQVIIDDDGNIQTYTCYICAATYKTKASIAKHILCHNPQIYTCKICNEHFKSTKSYTKHMRKHDKNYHPCPVCGKLLHSLALGRHMLSHKNEEGDLCEICGQILENQYLLYKHRNSHRNMIECRICKVLLEKSSYSKHLNSHYTNKYNKRYLLRQCPKCNYTSAFRHCLDAHINRIHLKARPYQCDICKKSYYSRLTLTEHIHTHSNEKPEQCDLCGNRFASKKALLYHTRIHTGERPYPCDLCDEKFISASRRQAHKIRKHSKRELQCAVCSKMFFTNACLRAHMRRHMKYAAIVVTSS